MRSACCLPERLIRHRLRRLYPLDDGELFKFNLKSSVCQQTGLPRATYLASSLRSPLETFLHRRWRENPHGRQPRRPHRSRRARPLQGAASSIVFPGPISPMESLPPSPWIFLIRGPNSPCRIAFFSFFSFAAESKKESPSQATESCPFWYVFPWEIRACEKDRGRPSVQDFPCFFPELTCRDSAFLRRRGIGPLRRG